MAWIVVAAESVSERRHMDRQRTERRPLSANEKQLRFPAVAEKEWQPVAERARPSPRQDVVAAREVGGEGQPARVGIHSYLRTRELDDRR